MNSSIIKEMSRRLKAISDPTRIKIVVLLAAQPSCVCELAKTLEISQPTVSRHLKQLEIEGFISSERDRNWVIYKLSPKRECCKKLLDILITRALEDKEARALVKRLQENRREKAVEE